MNPLEDMPGQLLTPPNVRGRLRVTPVFDRRTGKTKALRVRVFTMEGQTVVDFQATDSEATVIEFPVTTADGHPTMWLERRPGSFWFYGNGVEVGFLADQNAGALEKPLAVESPRTKEVS